MLRIRMFFCGLVVAAGTLLLAADDVHACGGLFCNASQPVNQAAERILFTKNGDGTVTAVIEIQYEGPSQSFSWVLPVPGVPKVGVSSTTAFDRLQQSTNPQYMLQTTFEDCGSNGTLSAKGGVATSAMGPVARGDSAEHGAVNVLAAGTVGPYDYKVIMVDPSVKDPADVAVQWLKDNEYDPAGGPDVLRPYLADGLNLLAFKLTKDSMTGSVRPVIITYESDKPFIPIRPTAVAANDDMGILVWVASEARAIPQNYKALELNEARIDWFNPMSTYDKVVGAAADEAGGQGFVTEMAGKSATLKNVIVQQYEAQEWQRISSQQYPDAIQFIEDSRQMFGSWDGFEEAVDIGVTLPAGISVSDFLNCTKCYASESGFTFDEAAFRKALFERVYKPMSDTESLLDSRPYVTRFYTTMSADEMTMDPAFDFNSGLADISNVHVAQRTIACDQSFRVTLPQGDTVYGKEPNVWPTGLGEQPAARKITQLAASGKGAVSRDNSDKITELLQKAADKHEGAIELAPRGGDAGPTLTGAGGDDGCRSVAIGASNPRHSALAGLAALAGALLFTRRRKRSR
jgi:LPXTG-motif cell wall-anchored protein